MRRLERVGENLEMAFSMTPGRCSGHLWPLLGSARFGWSQTQMQSWCAMTSHQEPPDECQAFVGPPRVPDGPRSVELDTLLRQLGLPSELALHEREDMGEGEWIAARTSYRDEAGGYVQAALQRHPPTGRLLDEVFTYGGRIPIQSWASGTEYVVKEPDVALPDHAQVIIRRPDGVVFQITAGGFPGKNVPRPMSRDDLLDLAHRADEALAK